MMPWKRAKIGQGDARAALCLCAGGGDWGLVWAMQTGRSALGPVGVFLGAWIVMGAADRSVVAHRTRRNRGSGGPVLAPAARRLGQGGGACGLGHHHVGRCRADGVAGRRYPRRADWRDLSRCGVYPDARRCVEESRGRTTSRPWASSRWPRTGDEIAQLRPEKRIYPVAQMPTTEAAIDYNFRARCLCGDR